jgi:hypothetical protein
VRFPVFGGCQKKPIKIEIVKEGDKRFLLRIYGDGSEERQPIVVKKKRQSAKIAWYWDMKTGRRKFY